MEAEKEDNIKTKKAKSGNLNQFWFRTSRTEVLGLVPVGLTSTQQKSRSQKQDAFLLPSSISNPLSALTPVWFHNKDNRTIHIGNIYYCNTLYMSWLFGKPMNLDQLKEIPL